MFGTSARMTSQDLCRLGSLYKLAWDLVGSEFAGRQMLYEKFYAGSSIVVRNQNDREAPWERFHAIVDKLLDEIAVPDFVKGASLAAPSLDR